MNLNQSCCFINCFNMALSTYHLRGLCLVFFNYCLPIARESSEKAKCSLPSILSQTFFIGFEFENRLSIWKIQKAKILAISLLLVPFLSWRSSPKDGPSTIHVYHQWSETNLWSSIIPILSFLAFYHIDGRCRFFQ